VFGCEFRIAFIEPGLISTGSNNLILKMFNDSNAAFDMISYGAYKGDDVYCTLHSIQNILSDLYPTLNYVNRWTHTNFSTFHAIQILTMIVKNLM
jgi:hypothetical protein